MNPASIQPRRCPLCGGTASRLVFERDAWPVVRCTCGMVYLSREYSYQEQAEHYGFSESYARERERRRRSSPVLAFLSGLTRRLKPPMAERLLGQTLRWRRTGRLLDIGCGDGAFLEAAARHFEVSGVEISPAMAERARRRLPGAEILTGPATGVELAAERFDIVTLFSVLEHEWRPLAALAGVARALCRGGIALVKVPNHASWNRTIRGVEWCGYRLPDHCNYFTPQTLSVAFKRARLRPLPRMRDMLPTSDSLWMAAEKD